MTNISQRLKSWLQGRQLMAGDYIDVVQFNELDNPGDYTLPECCRPSLEFQELRVLRGPHDSPELLTQEDCETVYSSTWEVGHNSSRTGIQLVGPKLQWARNSGGEGGSHASNLIDYPYPSPGGVNWTGDRPVIFPVDGPGFGGFLCTSTVISADLWRLGQLGPGDKVRFKPTTYAGAVEQYAHLQSHLRDLALVIENKEEASVSRIELDAAVPDTESASILKVLDAGQSDQKLTVRQVNLDNFEIGIMYTDTCCREETASFWLRLECST